LKQIRVPSCKEREHSLCDTRTVLDFLFPFFTCQAVTVTSFPAVVILGGIVARLQVSQFRLNLSLVSYDTV
jgi:hypothetical protein